MSRVLIQCSPLISDLLWLSSRQSSSCHQIFDPCRSVRSFSSQLPGFRTGLGGDNYSQTVPQVKRKIKKLDLSPGSPDCKPFFRIKALDPIKKKLGLFPYNRLILQDASMRLLFAATDDIPYENFLNNLELADTFDTWLSITCLHIWMIMARCNVEGKAGYYVGRAVCKYLWQDTDERINRLGARGRKTLNELNKIIGQAFAAFVYGLDEGLVTNDRILASALWRHFFTFKDVDPLVLELLVQYIRVQLKNLSEYDSNYLISMGEINWKPFPPLILER
ncbi:ubiquinol-cytochrome c reductase complex assembly factor 1 [Brevipalpus obovatus]|uniref:ubiquinol-cytochrome c reductase complex assembly factor 1 n=1 Tax=Brevipalpus obovatus TaxID=246614 RepID=UPI003D9E8226